MHIQGFTQTDVRPKTGRHPSWWPLNDTFRHGIVRSSPWNHSRTPKSMFCFSCDNPKNKFCNWAHLIHVCCCAMYCCCGVMTCFLMRCIRPTLQSNVSWHRTMTLYCYAQQCAGCFCTFPFDVNSHKNHAMFSHRNSTILIPQTRWMCLSPYLASPAHPACSHMLCLSSSCR